MRRSDHFDQLRNAGMTLPELLLVVLVLGLMAAVAVGGSQRALARMRVEVAVRQLAVGLEAARSGAHSRGVPCGLELSTHGWVAAAPRDGVLGCRVGEERLDGRVQLRHNLPAALRIASNGLVLDGGTLVLGAAGSDLQRCLVVSLPLGVVRIGRTTASPQQAVRSSDCVVDPTL